MTAMTCGLTAAMKDNSSGGLSERIYKKISRNYDCGGKNNTMERLTTTNRQDDHCGVGKYE